MKKLILSATLMVTLIFSNLSAQTVTPDMESTSGEYENSTAQWYVKEALALLLEQISYDGWEQTTDSEGNISVNVKFRDTFTDRIVTSEYGNSQMLLRSGLAKIIDPTSPVLSEEKAKEFYNKSKTTQIYANLRLRYDNNPRTFEEEFDYMKQVDLIPFDDISGFLRESARLVNWKNDFTDEYNML